MLKKRLKGTHRGIAIRPTTDIRSSSVPIGAIVWAGMMLGLKDVYIFTEEGHAAENTYRDVEKVAQRKCVYFTIGTSGKLAKIWVIEYNVLTMNRGKEISGPLLVFDGGKDPFKDFTLTEKAVYDTAMKYPDS
ncbi:hypothetical protein BOTNAR_0215g00030 [Botryotinia narcissicola]|uniref:Uncharacterized protein n=1 Tax=Botryotinia narcissicola TaxID=278944 RepID=A0A4Z1I5U0_9HELO|nr:hypothetical protein BOTNAR_0215g00030 [Botryotinia narcissicola]